MAILTRAAVIVALAYSFGCQRSPTLIDATQRSIAVHAVLVAGSDSATVLVTRPPSWQPIMTQPIANAHVRLVHGSDTVVALNNARACVRIAELAATSAGCYAALLPGGVRAGATYELLVNIAEETPIRGITRVPEPLQLLEPAASAEPTVLLLAQPNRSATPVTARWSGAAPEARTELRIVTDRSDCVVRAARGEESWWWSGLDHVVVTGVDSATVRVAHLQCSQPLAERYAAHLVVTVYDESYSRYVTWNDESPATVSAGLTGAYGVFGAAASNAVPLVLTVE